MNLWMLSCLLLLGTVAGLACLVGVLYAFVRGVEGQNEARMALRQVGAVNDRLAMLEARVGEIDVELTGQDAVWAVEAMLRGEWSSGGEGEGE